MPYFLQHDWSAQTTSTDNSLDNLHGKVCKNSLLFADKDVLFHLHVAAQISKIHVKQGDQSGTIDEGAEKE